MTHDEALQAARYRYEGDQYLTVADNPYDDVWECDGGYEVRAWIFVPAPKEEDDES